MKKHIMVQYANKIIKRTIPCLMLYHSGWWDMKQLNINYDEQNLDVEVVEPVTKSFEGNEEVQVYPMVIQVLLFGLIC